MTTRPVSRMSIAIALGFFVVIAQLSAFTAIAWFAWFDLFSPSTPFLKFPLVHLPQIFRGELVYPLCGMRFAPGMLQSGNVVCLRFVNLKTGRIRDQKIPGCASPPMGLVTDGKTLWTIGQREIIETDGIEVINHAPKRALGHTASSPFIYEGAPALIERDADGNYQLVAFVDGNWENRGQIALPGPDRAWIVDERTGNSVLVPRTSADSSVKGLKPLPLRVLSVRGQFHLFQIEGKSFRSSDDWVLSYRVGFDFIARPAEEEPASAMVPVNAPADTAGWVLLDSKLASISPCQATLNDELLLGNDREIWKQMSADGSTISTKFERVAQVDIPENTAFAFNIVSSLETNEVYVLAGDFVRDIEVFRLEGGELQKMPYRIEGMGGPLKRWLANVLIEGLAVLCVITIVLVFVAARWSSSPTYSFGHEAILLAPLVRRSLARCFDLSLIFGPLAMHAAWLVQETSLDSILMNVDDPSGLWPLLPAVLWMCLMWLASVVSTGLWGVTPGKLLFGIRVVQATLRPCGLSRALLRELLLWLDAPQLLTVLPGMLCYLVSRNRQRIGDQFAGTLVIAVPSTTTKSIV